MVNDVFSRWYDARCQDEGFSKFDFASLATALNNEDYEDLFDPDSTGDERLQELFREYVRALWVNSGHIDGNKSIFMPKNPGASIRDNYLLFHDTGLDENGNPSLWSCDDGWTYPYYAKVSEVPSTEYGPIIGTPTYFTWGDCTGDDVLRHREELLFETYGFEVLPFIADNSLTSTSKCYDLNVRITLEQFCDCKVLDGYDTDLEWDPNFDDPELPDEVLHFWILGYPDHTEELDRYGAEAVMIDSLTVIGPDLDDVISFTVPCFAAHFKSVVILGSLTEEFASSGVLVSQNIPYHFEYWAEESTISLGGGSIPNEGRFLCVDELVQIPQGTTVNIPSGTEVWMADPSLVGSDVGFKVEGSLAIGAKNGSSTSIKSLGTSWSGLAIGQNGSLTIDDTEITGIDEIDTMQGMSGPALFLSLDGVDLTFSDDANGLLLDKLATGLITDSAFRNSPYIVLGNTSLTSSIVEMERYTSGIGIEVVDDVTLNDVVLYNAYTGIKVSNGTATLDDVSAEMAGGPGIPKKRGLVVCETGTVNAQHCTFKDFEEGAFVEDTATLVLRDSDLYGTDIGVHTTGNSYTDLGNILPGGAGNNCIDGTNYRVRGHSTNQTMARFNHWYISPPDPSMFSGNVDWGNYLSDCPANAGGPDFSFVGGEASGESVALSVHPNPFNPKCTIRFKLPADERSCELVIYDIAGRRVATLYEGKGDGMSHELDWAGLMDSGGLAGSGVYLLSLRTETEVFNTKLVLVH